MKSTLMKFKTTLLASALAVTFAAGSASAAPLFTVDEGSIPGAVSNLVTADRLSFAYQGQIVQTVVGGSLAGAGDTFVETGFLNKGSFLNTTSTVPSQLNALNGYGLYATFTITGEADPLGNTGGISATFTSLTMTLYADPLQDTALTLGGANTGTGEDIALINYTLSAGNAHIFGGLANGDFDTLLNATLTPAGQSYFVGPTPFYDIENFGGNTQTFSIISGNTTSGFTANVAGGGLELFVSAVPEPSTYAMLLAGLGMMGFVARRRHKK